MFSIFRVNIVQPISVLIDTMACSALWCRSILFGMHNTVTVASNAGMHTSEKRWETLQEYSQKINKIAGTQIPNLTKGSPDLVTA